MLNLRLCVWSSTILFDKSILDSCGTRGKTQSYVRVRGTLHLLLTVLCCTNLSRQGAEKLCSRRFISAQRAMLCLSASEAI